jgi:hypothetical protein
VTAVEALAAILANGPLPVPEVKRRMRDAGWSGRGTEQARVKLDVETWKPTTFGGNWTWRLPDDARCPTCGGRFEVDQPPPEAMPKPKGFVSRAQRPVGRCSICEMPGEPGQRCTYPMRGLSMGQCPGIFL